MAKQTDLIVNGTARKQDKEIEEGGALRIREILGTQRPLERTEQPKEERTFDECQKTYNKLYKFLKGVVEAAKAEKNFSLEDGLKVISEIVEDSEMVECLYTKTLAYEDPSDVLVYHSINVFIYSIKVGFGLKYSKHQLIELGLAAMLHDIGMTKIPEEIIKKSSSLSAEELEILKEHPLYGHEILYNLGKEYGWLAEVALQEHEREQGQGYPKGLKGDEIHEYAKIIGIADVYEALTHPRPHRRKALPHEAIEELKTSFSHKILKAFLIQLTMYPPGCYVKLNSNIIGRVIAVNSNSPLRPKIEAICDSDGKTLEAGRIINLSEEPLLYITNCLHEEDLQLE